MATSDSRSIPWVIEQQTAVKHELLKAYIATWMKILWQQQERMKLPPHLIYVDGFAGPGEYWTSEDHTAKTDGSPIIVGKVANDLMDGQRKLDIIAFDADRETVDHLAPLLRSINTRQQEWEVSHANFLAGAQTLITRLSARLGRDYPTFFFVDPFGYSGFPMALLARILKNARTEVFITLMTYDIVRFIGTPAFRNNMTELFGTDNFAGYDECRTAEERVNFVTSLYRRQLLSVARARKVIGFRINTPGQGQRARYFLFHASNHIKALRVMKDAMDRTSDKDFRFEAIGVGAGEQFDLFVPRPETQIKSMVLARIENAPGPGLEYSVLEDWAYERTAGVARHIKTALVELESEGTVNIQRNPRQKKGTVTNGAVIRFRPTLL
jgi:three-Cys-motif partner protein